MGSWRRKMRRRAAREESAARDAEACARELLASVRVPLGPGDPRRHHFIPRFFLRRFADENQRLAVTPLESSVAKGIRSVANIAVMRDLYTTIDEEIGETVAVERILAVADADASQVIEQLTSDPPSAPSPAERASLSAWLGLLYVRDPHSRRRMEALADHVFKLDLSLASDPVAARARLRGDSGGEPDDADVARLVEAASHLNDVEMTPHQNQLVEMMLSNGAEIGRLLCDRHYAVLRFPEPGLVLADRPIVLYQRPENRSSLMGVGPATADEIWLPLDRRTILTLHRESDLGDVFVDARPGHDVDEFNQALASGAATEIYCHPSDCRRVDKLELPSGSHPLVQVSGADWASVESDGVNAPPVRKRPHRYRRSPEDETT